MVAESQFISGDWVISLTSGDWIVGSQVMISHQVRRWWLGHGFVGGCCVVGL